MKRDEYEEKIKSLPRLEVAILRCVQTPIHIFAVKGLLDTVGAWGVTSPMREPGGERYSVELEASLFAPGATLQLNEVFLHEMIHVVENVFGLSVREAQVRTLALGLKDLLHPLAVIPEAVLQRWHGRVRSVLGQNGSLQLEASTHTQSREPSPDSP